MNRSSFTFHPLQTPGNDPKMKASHFVRKFSVTFVQPDGRRSQPFYFFNRYDPQKQSPKPGRSSGRNLTRCCWTTPARRGGGAGGKPPSPGSSSTGNGWRASRPGTCNGDVRERRGADRSGLLGKEALASNLRGWRMRDPYLDKIAVWTTIVAPTRGRNRRRATTVAYVRDKGWFWHIPQHEDRVSVGLSPKGRYLTREESVSLGDFSAGDSRESMDPGSPGDGESTGDYYITSEYSCHSRFCAAPGSSARRGCPGFPGPCV